MDEVDGSESNHKLKLSINIAIAEKVFGHTVVKETWGKNKQYFAYSIGTPNWNDYAGEMKLDNTLPDYCNDISQAFEVVEHLKCKMELFRTQVGQDESDWACNLGPEFRNVYARNPAMAICKAALLLIGAAKNEPSQAW